MCRIDGFELQTRTDSNETQLIIGKSLGTHRNTLSSVCRSSPTEPIEPVRHPDNLKFSFEGVSLYEKKNTTYICICTAVTKPARGKSNASKHFGIVAAGTAGALVPECNR